MELPENYAGEQVMQAVRDFAVERDLRAITTPVSSESYSYWVEAQGLARYIITLLARKITSDQLARVTAVIAKHGLNIDSINRLSGRIPVGEPPALSKACVEFSARGSMLDSASFRRELLEVAGALEVDLAFQQDNMYRRTRRLVVFDMDSTLIEAEVIDELAKLAGVGDQVSAITELSLIHI